MSCLYLDTLGSAENKKQYYSICTAVILLHVLFFYFLSHDLQNRPIPKKATKLAVRTVVLAPKAPSLKTASTEKLVAVSEEPPKAEAKQPVEVKVEKVEMPASEQPVPEPVTKVAKPEPIKPVKAQPKIVEKPTTKQAPSTAKPQPKSKPAPNPKPATKPATKAQPKPDTAKIEKERLEKKQQQMAQQRAEQKAKEQAQAKQDALVAKALASLNSASKLDKKKTVAGTSRAAASAATSQIGTLSSESLVAIKSDGEVLTGREKTYYDELVQRLKLHLKLPDYGDVKVLLTLNRAGKVLKVECTTSKSQKNSSYLKKVLPSMSFPSFGQNFTGEKEHTFNLHFSNDFNY